MQQIHCPSHRFVMVKKPKELKQRTLPPIQHHTRSQAPPAFAKHFRAGAQQNLKVARRGIFTNKKQQTKRPGPGARGIRNSGIDCRSPGRDSNRRELQKTPADRQRNPAGRNAFAAKSDERCRCCFGSCNEHEGRAAA